MLHSDVIVYDSVNKRILGMTLEQYRSIRNDRTEVPPPSPSVHDLDIDSPFRMGPTFD